MENNKETTNKETQRGAAARDFAPKSGFRPENEAFKTPYQFRLKTNDNIIIQRYLHFPYEKNFNRRALCSVEFAELFHNSAGDGILDVIRQELVEKSRVYMWYTREEPMKLTGFVLNWPDYPEDDDKYGHAYSDVTLVSHNAGDAEEETVTLSDGRTVRKTYFTWPDGVKDSFADDSRPESWVTRFTFEFLVDDVVAYAYTWDATVYPRYIRNGVDLTNSDKFYSGVDPEYLHFNKAIVRRLNEGRPNHVKVLRDEIIDEAGGHFDEADYFTKEVTYGNKTYKLNLFEANKEVEDGWWKATERKSRKYFRMLRNEEEFAHQYGLTDGEWEFIENNL